jgi:hypothetical protein
MRSSRAKPTRKKDVGRAAGGHGRRERREDRVPVRLKACQAGSFPDISGWTSSNACAVQTNYVLRSRSLRGMIGEGETRILQGMAAQGKGTYAPSLRSEDFSRPRHADHMLVTTRVPHGKMADEGNCSVVHTGHTYRRHNKRDTFQIQAWHDREHNHMK